MDGKKWLVKSEVLQDLAKVGNVVLDDLHTVADKPPAIILRDEDDFDADLHGRFGHTSEKIEKPDLYSISRMINMVKEYDGSPSFSEQYLENNNIVISKLNPKVQEFIPKEIKKITSDNNLKAKEIASSSDSNIIENGSNSAFSSRDSKTEQAVLLKKKITEQSGQNSITARRERNVAISNLLKLYSSPDTKLSQEKENNQQETKLEQNAHEKTRIPEPISPGKNNLDVSPEEMQQSIKKVDSWLNGPDPTPANTTSTSNKPFQSVAPTYKRKIKKSTTEVSASQENVQPHIMQPETPSSCPKFKGTKNYTELYKKFHEGSLRVQQQQQEIKESRNFRRETLWDIVENKLKEKEEKRWEITTATKEKTNAGP